MPRPRSLKRIQLENRPCPTCKAAAGESCRSLTTGRTSGQGRGLVHSARRPDGQGGKRGRPQGAFQLEATTQPCPTCGAGAEQLCRSRISGQPRYHPHTARTETSAAPFLTGRSRR